MAKKKITRRDSVIGLLVSRETYEAAQAEARAIQSTVSDICRSILTQTFGPGTPAPLALGVTRPGPDEHWVKFNVKAIPTEIRARGESEIKRMALGEGTGKRGRKPTLPAALAWLLTQRYSPSEK